MTSLMHEQSPSLAAQEGGRAIGLGTFRGVSGKFRIESWA
jgi:hypothetical protein